MEENLSYTLSLRNKSEYYDNEGKGDVAKVMSRSSRRRDLKTLVICRDKATDIGEQPEARGYEINPDNRYSERFIPDQMVPQFEPFFSVSADGYNPIESDMTQEHYSEL